MINSKIEQAKELAFKATSKYLSLEEASARLDDYRIYAQRATTEKDRLFWKEEIESLDQWLKSDQLQNKTHPQGIDDLVIDLIEWRATIHAFQNVELERAPFESSLFFAQWKSGAAYSIACIIGKLASRDSKDNSITNLWEKISDAIVLSNRCTKDEAQWISKILHRQEGRFNNASSAAMRVRNKVVAHNEHSLHLEWSAVDEDIKILVRVWAIVVAFCSFGIIEPFCRDEQAFSHIDCINPEELQQLTRYRREFINKVVEWSKLDLYTGCPSQLPSAFASISVTISLPQAVPDAT